MAAFLLRPCRVRCSTEFVMDPREPDRVHGAVFAAVEPGPVGVL
ncbi:hypothetical protein [Actinoplanes sp. NPDC051411]